MEADFVAELTKQSPNTTDTSQNGVPAADPAEVDISEMFKKPREEISAQEQQEMLRQMLAATSTPPSGLAAGQQGPELDDPLLRMMQQLMGGAGGAGGDAFASMLGGQETLQAENNGDYLWRIIHAVFSVGLGLYAALNVTFQGTELSRSQYPGDGLTLKLFWMFATTELVLQSTRYFVDRGKLPVSGLLSSIGQILPEPYANYVRIFNRYSIIYTTLMTDAMVLIFVLGCVAWWNDLAPA